MSGPIRKGGTSKYVNFPPVPLMSSTGRRIPLTRLVASLWTNRQRRRALVRATTLVSASAALAYYWPEVSFAAGTTRRFLRTAWHVGLICLDYKLNYPSRGTASQDDDDLAPKVQLTRDTVHERAARRLLRLIEINGGIYIKVGQHLSALEYILPPIYCRLLSVLHSQAPQSSTQEVALVWSQEFANKLRGREADGVQGDQQLNEDFSLGSVFSEFDPIPIGAASLAQVHRARLRSTGEYVAVKVQHARLQHSIVADITTISMLVSVVKRLFPEFDFEWIADELRTNLPRELDFESEAHNAERAARNFALSGYGASRNLRIPRIYWQYTSKRVLCMEYLPGVKASEREAILSMGIDCAALSEFITKIFSEMIFIHGFVHCDPHPGNLLVRQADRGTRSPLPSPSPWSFSPLLWVGRHFTALRRSCPFEVVLLDHGLYRELPDSFRMAYARLWRAVIDADEPGMRQAALDLGGGDAYRLFTCILTQRPWRSVSSPGSISRARTREEAAEMLAKAPEYLGRVAELLAKLPRPLLLLLKTNDLLRHLERALMESGPSTNGQREITMAPSRTFIIMAHYCVDAAMATDGSVRRWWYHAKLYLWEWLQWLLLE